MMKKVCFILSLFFLTGCASSLRVVDLYLEDTDGYEITDITIANADNMHDYFPIYKKINEGKLQILVPKSKKELNLEFYKSKERYKDYKPKSIYKHQYVTLTPVDSEISLTFEKTNSYIKHEILLDELIETTQIVKGTVLDDIGQPLPNVFVKVLNLPLEFDDENFWSITDEYGRFEVRVNKEYNQIQFNHSNHIEKIVTLKSLGKPITVKLLLEIIE